MDAYPDDFVDRPIQGFELSVIRRDVLGGLMFPLSGLRQHYGENIRDMWRHERPEAVMLTIRL